MLCPLTLERDIPAFVPRSRKDQPAPKQLADTPDGELALAWRAGNNEALRQLVDRHRKAVYGLALRLCADPDLAEDLAQETFLRALSRIHQYDTTAPFRPWIFRILAHLHVDYLRRHREIPEEVPPPVSHQGNAESTLFVQEVLESLPAAQRSLLILREVIGLSYEELAHAFAIPVGTVRSRLAHARLAFREAYQNQEGEVRL